MKVEIKMPGMGESISQATVGTILKATGERVKADEEIVEIETDKVNQALYSPKDGVMAWNVKSGDVVKIGQVLGYVEEGGKETKEKPSQEKPSKEEPSKKESQKEKLSKKETPEEEPSQEEPSKEEPSKKELPKKEPPKPEMKAPQPTEKGARLSKEEFLKEAPKEESKETKSEENETRTKMSKVRRVIAERMVEALQTTAMLTTFNEVDMSQVIALREKHKEAFLKEYGVKLGFMSFFVKAVVSALKQFPYLNAYMEGDEIVERHYYNLGVAVGTDKGVFVPVIKNSDQLSFAQIEKAILEYARKVKEGRVAIDDLQGGGFTITNGGIYGSLLSTPILNPPQSGILGMHRIQKRPVAIEDKVEIRPMMYLALSYDHRIVDGKEAVSFLVHIKNHLEDPALELLDL